MTTPDYLAQYDPPLQPTGAASAERERAAHVLCVHYAAGHLETEELEHRLTLVYQSQTSADLERLLAGLPSLSATVEFGGVPLLAPSGAVPPRGVIMAFMSGAVRKGSWLCPRELTVYALMGGVDAKKPSRKAVNRFEAALRVAR